MSTQRSRELEPAGGARRADVLESALRTFARHGYRKTSMDDVAADARISRPGLYLYFRSKQALLRAAVEQVLANDVAEAEVLLEDGRSPLGTRLLGAFDLWAGKYTGPLATDLDGLLEQDASLLGDLPANYRRRFRVAVERAIATATSPSGEPRSFVSLSVQEVTDVLLALAAGTKHQAADRHDFRTRYQRGLDLLLH